MSPAPVTQATGGLTGLVGWQYQDPEATPEERLGGTADPRHAAEGEAAGFQYPSEVMPGQPHGPYGVENQLLGANPEGMVDTAGMLYQDPTADLQPITHAAPWPKGVPSTAQPDGTAEWRAQNAEIHTMGMGSDGSYLSPSLEPVQDDWIEITRVGTGSSLQDTDMNGQLKTTGSHGAGSRDRVSSTARQNGYGFDQAHGHRRVAAVGSGALPGNFMWMQPGSRPLIKTLVHTARPAVGQDSPFTGDDTGLRFDTHGSVLSTAPAAYVPPVDPVQAVSYPAGSPAPVQWY